MISLIEAEEAHVSEAATYQDALLLKPLQLTLSHVQAKPECLGNALRMALAIALQEQQYAGGGSVAKERVEDWVHRKRLLVEPRFGVSAPPLWVEQLIMGVLARIRPRFVGHAVLPPNWREAVRQLVESLRNLLLPPRCSPPVDQQAIRSWFA